MWIMNENGGKKKREQKNRILVNSLLLLLLETNAIYTLSKSMDGLRVYVPVWDESLSAIWGLQQEETLHTLLMEVLGEREENDVALVDSSIEQLSYDFHFDTCPAVFCSLRLLSCLEPD